MITQEKINLELSYLHYKMQETPAAKWIKDKIQVWQDVQSTLVAINEKEFDYYLLELDYNRTLEMLYFIDEVFDALGWLGDDFQNVITPRRIDSFYFLSVLRLMPKDESFRQPLLKYLNGILKKDHTEAVEQFKQRQYAPNPYPNQYTPKQLQKG